MRGWGRRSGGTRIASGEPKGDGTKKPLSPCPSPGGSGGEQWATGTMAGLSRTQRTEKAMGVLGGRARLEHRGGSTPALWRPTVVARDVLGCSVKAGPRAVRGFFRGHIFLGKNLVLA